MKALVILSFILGSNAAFAGSRVLTLGSMKRSITKDSAALRKGGVTKLMDLNLPCAVTVKENEKGNLVVAIDTGSIKLIAVKHANEDASVNVTEEEGGRLIYKTYDMSLSEKVVIEIIEDKVTSIAIEGASTKLTCAVD